MTAEDVVFVGIDFAPKKYVERYVKRNKIPFPEGYGYESSTPVYKFFSGSLFPWTTVVGRDGKVVGSALLHFKGQKVHLLELIEKAKKSPGKKKK